MPQRPKLLVPIPPGEILREDFMRPLGISINALARALSVPPNRIGAIVNGTRAITADTALRLGRHFGTSPELWLDLRMRPPPTIPTAASVTRPPHSLHERHC